MKEVFGVFTEAWRFAINSRLASMILVIVAAVIFLGTRSILKSLDKAVDKSNVKRYCMQEIYLGIIALILAIIFFFITV